MTPGIGTDGFATGALISRSGNDRFAHYAFIQHDREDGGRPDDPDQRTLGFAQAKVSLTERDSIFGSYTDVTRDGQLSGPDLKGAATLAAPGLDVIVSGGVAALEDLRAARRAGLAGAVVGRALHEGRFTLAEAVACLA